MASVINQVHKKFQEVVKDTLSEMPIWMKCNYLMNTILKTSATINELNKDVDWNKINEILKTSKLDIDYNIFDKINSIEELENLRISAITASIPEFNEAYYKKICKNCGDTFFLTLNEVNWYKEKDLKIPCKCYYCRKKLPKPTPVNVGKVKKKEEEPIKTSMQLALEKIGMC